MTVIYHNFLQQFEVVDYDDITFRNITQIKEYKDRFKDEVTPLPFSKSKKDFIGIFAFDKTKGVEFYNSVNLRRIIDGLSSYFIGDTKRKVSGSVTYYKAMEIRMYQAQLKQVLYIEDIFKEYDVSIHYTINYNLSYDSENFK